MENISKDSKLKIASIAFILAIWILSYIISPIYGTLNGLYFASILTGIYLFRDKYIIALILNINSQLLILATFLLNGEVLEDALTKVGFELPTLVIVLSIYMIINASYKRKHKENKQLKLNKMSRSAQVILISLIVITTVPMMNYTNAGLIPLLYTGIIPLLMVVTMALHTKEYYLSTIIYSSLGLYVCYMQIVIGQLPYLHIITNITLLIASIYELKKVNNK